MQPVGQPNRADLQLQRVGRDDPRQARSGLQVVKRLNVSKDWQIVSVKTGELIATDPEVTAPLANWQPVTEFSISPSGTTLRDGQKVKADGKPWKGPREIRNLRWEGGE